MTDETNILPWTASVLTLFPKAFPGPLGVSIIETAAERGIWALETVDIRDFSRHKHRSVDDTPYPLTQFGHVRFARITEPRTILIAALAQPPVALIVEEGTVITHNPTTRSAVVLPSE